MECTDLKDFSTVARDHAAQPQNHGPLKEFDSHARITGPCGDTMEFWLSVRNGKVKKASFITDGCGPSLACGSMATSLAEGKLVEDVAALTQEDIIEALGGLPPDSEHCALLAANTLRASCQDCLSNQKRSQQESPGEKGTCETCGDKDCSAATRKKDESDQDFADRQALESRLCRIRHKVVVLSGKGGVGKSTVAVNIAVALRMAGKRVGLLDVDIHGPSVPTMLGLENEKLQGGADGLLPVDLAGLKVMSLGFLLNDQDQAVIWRGPMKNGVIKQFIKDVAWGDLDYLIVDSPPGTGDEPLSVCQLIGKLDGAVVVTTPQKVAAVDVRKSITFCRQLGVPVLGVVENMSGFVCPKCGEISAVFSSGGGQRIATGMNVPFLGSIPIDPLITESCDNGRPFVRHFAASPTAEIMQEIIRPLLALQPATAAATMTEKIENKEKTNMKIVIPVADGKLSMHFGHCERFALIDVDPTEKKILKREDLEAPPHEPGLLPKWLAERGANLIIAGGMGQRAQDLFHQHGIKVIIGAPAETPENLVNSYLAGSLQSGDNVCDH